MKIERIVIAKGKSVPVNGPEGEWNKTFYQLEALLAEGDNIQVIKADLENMIDYWLSTGSKPVETAINVESLPWTDFKNKKGAWIFSKKVEAKSLLEKLKQRPDKTLEIGDYKYTISGDQGQFISRFKKAEQVQKA